MLDLFLSSDYELINTDENFSKIIRMFEAIAQVFFCFSKEAEKYQIRQKSDPDAVFRI